MALQKKFNPDGTLKTPITRLLSKGYTQQLGYGYSEMFSPVIKSTTLRLVIDIAIRNMWLIQQLDVNNAFLQGTVTDEVYMEQLHGFIYSDKHDHVFHLHKAIYGLNKAPRTWYTELKTFILSLGFFNSLTYTSLFVFQMALEKKMRFFQDRDGIVH